MSLSDQINEDIKTAMKSRDKDTLQALRAIKSKLLLEATKDGSSEVTEEAEMAILKKLYKQHNESAEIYKKEGRDDLFQEEMAGANVIKKYLPEQMGEAEIKAKVEEIIAQVGATGPQDMGKVMGAATKAFAGKADNKIVAGFVREILTS